jgi:hypothetical protein
MVYHGELLLGEYRFLIEGVEGMVFCRIVDGRGAVVCVKEFGMLK